MAMASIWPGKELGQMESLNRGGYDVAVERGEAVQR
jgi:hypothetical protein